MRKELAKLATKQKARLLPRGRSKETLFFAFLALPLVVVGGHNQSLVIRILFFFGISALLVASATGWSSLRKNLISLSLNEKICLGLILSGLLLSTILSSTQAPDLLLGLPGDYLGVLPWLFMLLLAIAYKDDFARLISSKPAAFLVTFASAFSLVLYSSIIGDGYRLGGTQFHATNAGVWACVGLLLCLNQLFKNKNALMWSIAAFINVTACILTQSRIAVWLCAALLILYISVFIRAGKLVLCIVASCLLVVGVALVTLTPQRFSNQKIENGISYRTDLYLFTAPKIISNPLGVGASSAGQLINNPAGMPKSIQKTVVADGFVFWYAHNIFIDIGLMFGVLSLAGFVFLTILAFGRALRSKNYFYIALLIILLANGAVNTPSLALTALLVIALFANTPARLKKTASPPKIVS